MKVRKTHTFEEAVYQKFDWVCEYQSINASAWLNRKIMEFVNQDENKVALMIGWFKQHYKDPANGVPYDSREGGYQYFNGGPYDPHEVLTEQFPNYNEDLITAATDELYPEGSEWVRDEDY